MYEIRIRRKAGTSIEKVGMPYADHTEAVGAIEALLNERFSGRWCPSPNRADAWFVDGRLGAKLITSKMGRPPKFVNARQVSITFGDQERAAIAQLQGPGETWSDVISRVLIEAAK